MCKGQLIRSFKKSQSMTYASIKSNLTVIIFLFMQFTSWTPKHLKGCEALGLSRRPFKI